MAHDVLISYSSRDKLQADALCNRLESRGIRCWIAPRDVGLGEYAESIVEAIEAAEVMVLVFSSNADQSHQVRREVERAVSKGKKIVPVRIEDAEMSKSFELYVSSVHWLDAITPPFEQHIDKLADELGALLGKNAETAEPSAGEAAAAPSPPAPAAAPKASPAAKPSTPDTPLPPATPDPTPAVTSPAAAKAPAPPSPPAAKSPPATEPRGASVPPTSSQPPAAAGTPAATSGSSPLAGKLPIMLGAAAIIVIGLIWVMSMSGGEDATVGGDPAVPPGSAAGESVGAGAGAGAEGQMAATMTFFNDAAVPVRIYAVDADGNEQEYAIVDPQESHTEPTDDGQLWLVATADADGEMEIVTCQASGPESECLIELVTGWTVVAVEFGTADGEYLGTYRAVADGIWVEEGPDGSARFEFTEESRDDWSVYLYDELREVVIAIDLWSDKITYDDGIKPPADLYEILAASESEI